MLKEAAKSFAKLVTRSTGYCWMYHRGKNIKEEDIDIIAGGAGVAAALGADFVKVKYPLNKGQNY